MDEFFNKIKEAITPDKRTQQDVSDARGRGFVVVVVVVVDDYTNHMVLVCQTAEPNGAFITLTDCNRISVSWMAIMRTCPIATCNYCADTLI